MALQTSGMNVPGGGMSPLFGETPAKVLCLTEVYLPAHSVTSPFLLVLLL